MHNLEFFYRKPSLGKDGKPFFAYKIRTMELGADQSDIVDLSERDGFGKMVENPRITRLGRIFRRYWIDEWPQITNILRGEMSFVGIRPKTERAWNRYSELISKLTLGY